MSKHAILYIGQASALSITPEEILKKINCTLRQKTFEKDKFDKLLESIFTRPPEVIIIEVNSVDHDLLNFLLLLKSHNKLSHTKIIALFSDKSGLDKYKDIYSFGVDYSFIASEEKDRIASDLSHIVASAEAKPLHFAKAENIKIPAQVTFLSKISHFTQSHLYIETALSLTTDDIIEARANLHQDIDLKYFKVKKTNCFEPRSYFTNTAELEILFEHTQGLQLKSDTKQTSSSDFNKFFTELQSNIFYRNDPALILDSRIETMTSLIGEMNVNNRFIKVSNSYQHSERIISSFLPQIICFQMEAESDDMADDERLRIHGTTTFNALINRINSIPGYTPFVLVFNQKSRSKAYRKAYNYEQIIVNPKPFELSYLSMIMDEYQNQHPVDQSIKFLKPPDDNTVFEINRYITLTSISENVLTFLFLGDLAPYSTFIISDPLNIYVTVIPTNDHLAGDETYHHYLGFISSTNEEDKMNLRKLVNVLLKAERLETETISLKSVRELHEDIIQAKVEELKQLRKEQKAQYKKKKDEDEEFD